VAFVILNSARKSSYFNHYLSFARDPYECESWEGLWLDSIGVCDLPKWKGKPNTVVGLNGEITIAQKAANVYIVVFKYSS